MKSSGKLARLCVAVPVDPFRADESRAYSNLVNREPLDRDSLRGILALGWNAM